MYGGLTDKLLESHQRHYILNGIDTSDIFTDQLHCGLRAGPCLDCRTFQRPGPSCGAVPHRAGNRRRLSPTFYVAVMRDIMFIQQFHIGNSGLAGPVAGKQRCSGTRTPSRIARAKLSRSFTHHSSEQWRFYRIWAKSTVWGSLLSSTPRSRAVPAAVHFLCNFRTL